MDDSTIRIASVVIGHLMWLSAAALRILRGDRATAASQRSSWLVEHYPILVWVPLVLAVFFAIQQVDLGLAWQLAGVVIALGGSLLAAWATWSLGREYGVKTDVLAVRRLRTAGPFALVRHPMYLGILDYHVGASLALESLALLLATALVIVPYTAVRIAAEERVLRLAFGAAWGDYARRVPALLPLPR